MSGPAVIQLIFGVSSESTVNSQHSVLPSPVQVYLSVSDENLYK